ncbi:MAG: glycosyltransferase [Prevotella sp.]|nr:glycosyltransferase [Prevotella sp.]
MIVSLYCGEAYGLVYLEAMARGCVTIASKREGFDGVIVDGENGFLCKAGDSDELVQIMKRISEMSVEEKKQISEKAIETAKSLTDFKAAKLYIDDVIRLTK